MLAAAAAFADEKLVGVPGSKVEYPAAIKETIDGKPLELRITGAGMRTKAFFNVYAIASYVAPECKAKTPEEVAAADCAKRLHLVMEREVSGKDMASYIRAGIEANYPQKFDGELKAMEEKFAKANLKPGTHIVLTYTPGGGLMALVGEKEGFAVESKAFAQAVWEIYFGKKPIAAKLKKQLAARL
jgi:hypothetical protein